MPWLDLTPSQGTKILQAESMGRQGCGGIRSPNYILRQEKTFQFFFPHSEVQYNRSLV